MTRILIVDDEPQLLRALVLNLRNRGYDVATATSGRDAIEQVVGLPPDVVVLDLGLPDRDGLAVIGELRSREPALPIVVLSDRTGSHDKVAALDLGAIDYVTKPFDMNELIARLRAVHGEPAQELPRARSWSDPTRSTSSPEPRAARTAPRCISPRRSGASWTCCCTTPAG
jgi:two-component system KDP operon response regulator KdpE